MLSVDEFLSATLAGDEFCMIAFMQSDFPYIVAGDFRQPTQSARLTFAKFIEVFECEDI